MFNHYYALCPSDVRVDATEHDISDRHEAERRQAIQEAQAQFTEQNAQDEHSYRKCA